MSRLLVGWCSLTKQICRSSGTQKEQWAFLRKGQNVEYEALLGGHRGVNI